MMFKVTVKVREVEGNDASTPMPTTDELVASSAPPPRVVDVLERWQREDEERWGVHALKESNVRKEEEKNEEVVVVVDEAPKTIENTETPQQRLDTTPATLPTRPSIRTG